MGIEYHLFDPDTMQENIATAYATLNMGDLSPRMLSIGVKQAILRAGFQGFLEGEIDEVLDALDSNFKLDEMHH